MTKAKKRKISLICYVTNFPKKMEIDNQKLCLDGYGTYFLEHWQNLDYKVRITIEEV